MCVYVCVCAGKSLPTLDAKPLLVSLSNRYVAVPQFLPAEFICARSFIRQPHLSCAVPPVCWRRGGEAIVIASWAQSVVPKTKWCYCSVRLVARERFLRSTQALAAIVNPRPCVCLYEWGGRGTENIVWERFLSPTPLWIGCRHLALKKRKFATSVCVFVFDVFVFLGHSSWVD